MLTSNSLKNKMNLITALTQIAIIPNHVVTYFQHEY